MTHTYHFKQTQTVAGDLETVWRFFSAAENLKKITPPGMRFEIIDSGGTNEMFQGQLIRYKVSPFPFFRVTWVTEIAEVDVGKSFVDIQKKGPFAMWHHRHSFKQVTQGVEMTDEVAYQIPWGYLGTLAHAMFVRQRVKEIFRFRAEKISQLFPNRK